MSERNESRLLRAHPDACLSPSQLEALADKLVAERQARAVELERLHAEITRKEDCSVRDAAEAASLKEQVTRASGIAEQHRAVLAEIDSALQRLASGSYGVSDVSGEPVPFDRLASIPWARSRADE